MFDLKKLVGAVEHRPDFREKLPSGKFRYVKYGRTKEDKQRWLDRITGITFIEEEYRDRGNISKRLKGLRALMEGVSQSAAGRLVGVSHVTIRNWMDWFSEFVPGIEAYDLTEDDIIELDEICVKFKKKGLTHAKWIWIWTAVCRRTRQVIGFVIGDRKRKTFSKLWKQIRCLPCRNYRTDYLKAYRIIARDRIHIATKAETYTVESKNSQFRQYVPPLRRRTKGIARSEQTLYLFVLFCCHKINLLADGFFW